MSEKEKRINLELEIKCIDLNKEYDRKRIYSIQEVEFNKYKLVYSEFINKTGLICNYGEFKDA